MGMPTGPLPKPADERRRRNQPTIPTTRLSVDGPDLPAPECPYPLRERGAAWWAWAWSTPSACAWDRSSTVYLAARRAQLEDDMEALSDLGFDLDDFLEASDVGKVVKQVVQALKATSGGALAIQREMTTLDDRLGLNPKAMAQLRWEVVPAEAPEADKPAGPAKSRRLQIVDPAAVSA